jgi:hypothetical protein
VTVEHQPNITCTSALYISSERGTAPAAGMGRAQDGEDEKGTMRSGPKFRTNGFELRLASMSILSFLCRLITAGERTRPEQTAATRTSADLGQKEAKREAQSKEQLGHMEGKTTSAQKPKSR